MSSLQKFGSVARFASLGLALSSLSLASCAQNQESILVTKSNPINEDCSVEVSANFLSRGLLDVSFDSRFIAAYTIRNNLIETGTNTAGQVENSEMYLKEVQVRLDTPQDPDLIAAVRSVDPALVEFTQPVATNSFDGQDEIWTSVEIPAAVATALRGAMQAKYSDDVRLDMTMEVTFRAVRASNELASEVGVEDARPFTLPVELCLNCLRAPACVDSSDPTIGAGMTCGNAQVSGVISDGSVGVIPSDCAIP